MLRSVEYDSVCKDPSCSPSKAGIPSWAIAVSVLVVLLIAVAIFLVYKYFPLITHAEIFLQPSCPGERAPATMLCRPTTEYEIKRLLASDIM